MPGAEVLGGEVIAPRIRRAVRDFAQVVVHVARAHGARGTVFILVLEEFLPRQLLAAPHHAGYARVAQFRLLPHAAFAAKAQAKLAALELCVARSQRGEAVRAVGGGVFLVAHAQVGGVEQSHQRREYQCAFQGLAAAVRRQVARHPAADPGQRPAKRQHVFELALVALRAPQRVVAVLATPACIQPRGLQVAVGQGADPHVGIRGRNGQALDACDLVLVLEPLTVRQAVAEGLFARGFAGEPRHGWADVHQASRQPCGPGRWRSW